MSQDNDSRFSIFNNSLSKQPSGSVTIAGYFDLISNPQVADMELLTEARHYHSIGEFDTYKNIKAKVRAFTPHLYFGFNIPKRSLEYASQNSGYVFVEIDVKPNNASVSESNSHLFHMKQNRDFKESISKDPYVMGVHDSASVYGKVVVFLKQDFIEIKIGDKVNNQLAKDEHEAYVREIGIYLYETYGVVIDPNCMGINQPRYYSQDSGHYFNPYAKPWELKSKVIRDVLKSGKHDSRGKSKTVCKKLKERYDITVGKTNFTGSLRHEIKNNFSNLMSQVKIHFRQYNYYQISSGEKVVGERVVTGEIGNLISDMFKYQGKDHKSKYLGDVVERYEINHLIRFLDQYFYGQYLIDFDSYRFECVDIEVISRRDIKIGEYLEPDDIMKSLSPDHILYLIANAGLGKTTAFLKLPVPHKILAVPRELIITAKSSDLKSHSFGFHYGGKRSPSSSPNVVCCHNGLIMAVKHFRSNFPNHPFVLCIDEAQLFSESFGVKKNMINMQFITDLVHNDPLATVLFMSGTPAQESKLFPYIKVVQQKFVSTTPKKNDIFYNITPISHKRFNEDMCSDLISVFRKVISKQKRLGKTSHNFIYANIKEESAKAIAETLGYKKYVILRTNNNGSKSVMEFLERKTFDNSLVFLNSSITTGVDFVQRQTSHFINIFMINQHFDSNTGIQHMIQAPARFRSHRNVLVHSIHNMLVIPSKPKADDDQDHMITSDQALLRMDMLITSNRVKKTLSPLDISSSIQKFGLGVRVNDVVEGEINKDFVNLRTEYYKISSKEKKNIRKEILTACGFNINILVEIAPKVKDLKNYDDDQTLGMLEKELKFDIYDLFFSDPHTDIMLGHRYFAEFRKIIKEYNDYKKEMGEVVEKEYNNYV